MAVLSAFFTPCVCTSQGLTQQVPVGLARIPCCSAVVAAVAKVLISLDHFEECGCGLT